MAALQLVGKLTQFKPDQETIDNFLERFREYCDLNAHALGEDPLSLHAAVFPPVDGPMTTRKKLLMLGYLPVDVRATLNGLCHPMQPREKRFIELQTLLRQHFNQPRHARLTNHDARPLAAMINVRSVFFKIAQKEEESVQDFITRLCRQADRCNFGNSLEEMLHDQFRKGLWPGKNLTFQETVALLQQIKAKAKQSAPANKEHQLRPMGSYLESTGKPKVLHPSGLHKRPRVSAQTGPTGTTIKFQVVTETDTLAKNGQTQNISTRHNFITCMKEYKNKSLEELRLEDYMANRKGPQNPTGGIFGTTHSTLSPFATPSTSTTTGGLFGSTENKSLFGQSSNMNVGTFGSTAEVFGSNQPLSGSLFAKPGTGVGTATTCSAPGFRFSSTTSAPVFRFSSTTSAPVFRFSSTTSASPFGGANNQAKPFGMATPQTNLFGTPSTKSGEFGLTPTLAFGAFGQDNKQQNTGGLFNQNKPAFSLGSNSSSGFSFGQNTTATAGTNHCGVKSTTPGFGVTPAFGTSTAGTTAFSGTQFGATTTTQANSLFGNTFNKPAYGFSFGPTTTTNTGLGTGLGMDQLQTKVKDFDLVDTKTLTENELRERADEMLTCFAQFRELLFYTDFPIHEKRDPAKNESRFSLRRTPIDKAAIVIQRRWRDILTNRRREEFLKLRFAAIVIQRAWRRKLRQPTGATATDE